jgi:hypothetical protein
MKEFAFGKKVISIDVRENNRSATDIIADDLAHLTAYTLFSMIVYGIVKSLTSDNDSNKSTETSDNNVDTSSDNS